jgi:hypothetical protein
MGMLFLSLLVLAVILLMEEKRTARVRERLQEYNRSKVSEQKAPEGRAVDISKLVVGQDVYMFLDPYPYWFCANSGKVAKVTPDGVDVQTTGELLRFDTNNIPVFIVGQTTLVVGQEVDVAYSQRKDRRGKVVKVTPLGVEVEVSDLLRFDNNGNEPDAIRRDRLGFGPSPDDNFYTFLWYSAPEFGPWHIDDMPFAERTALLEQKLHDLNVEAAARKKRAKAGK